MVGQQIRHHKTKPYSPRHNGKVERCRHISTEGVLYAREFTSEYARAAAISVWSIHYSSIRAHRASVNNTSKPTTA
ncbi:integrase core domain-containing protein [Streptomyces sp. PU-14G]|uniref:integrase core domain-containing protein n=1 Tax=Streptomyces sp. PU-14G TaxID=2800808 RepID=UPI0034DEEE76